MSFSVWRYQKQCMFLSSGSVSLSYISYRILALSVSLKLALSKGSSSWISYACHDNPWITLLPQWSKVIWSLHFWRLPSQLSWSLIFANSLAAANSCNFDLGFYFWHVTFCHSAIDVVISLTHLSVSSSSSSISSLGLLSGPLSSSAYADSQAEGWCGLFGSPSLIAFFWMW